MPYLKNITEEDITLVYGSVEYRFPKGLTVEVDTAAEARWFRTAAIERVKIDSENRSPEKMRLAISDALPSGEKSPAFSYLFTPPPPPPEPEPAPAHPPRADGATRAVPDDVKEIMEKRMIDALDGAALIRHGKKLGVFEKGMPRAKLVDLLWGGGFRAAAHRAPVAAGDVEANTEDAPSEE